MPVVRGYTHRMTHSLFVALIAFAFVSSITPGPNNLMLMASGINFGFARTIPHMLGVGIGFTVMIVAVGAGVAGAIAAVPGAFTAIKWISAAYLLWMAWKIATSVPKLGSAERRARPFGFFEAAAFQWINPKAWTMALTAAAAYVPADDPTTGLLIVAAVFGAINLPSVSLWALMGTSLRRVLADPKRMRAFNIVAACTLVATLYPIVMG